METTGPLLRTRTTAVWLALTLATLVSWSLGGRHVPGGEHTLAAITIILIAIVKVRFVGLYFMDLRNAPLPLRGIFEIYCLALLGVLAGLYLAD